MYTRIVHIHRILWYLRRHFSVEECKTSFLRFCSWGIVHWPVDQSFSPHRRKTFARAGPLWFAFVWIADLFARRADGNAFAEDLVVISKVEKSTSLIFFFLFVSNLLLNRELYSDHIWLYLFRSTDPAAIHIQNRNRVIRRYSSWEVAKGNLIDP